MEYGKLIELLNEYQQDFRYQDESDVDYREERIISKSYGFIKRLVENDKIKSEYISGGTILANNHQYITYTESEDLIMQLSIQDNPLEYLCSILKE